MAGASSRLRANIETLLDGLTWRDALRSESLDPRIVYLLTTGFYPRELDRWVAFCRMHGELDRFRHRLDVRPERLTEVCLHAVFAEMMVGWFLGDQARLKFLGVDPPGERGHAGDWLFELQDGRELFVEVKSLWRPDPGEFVGARRPPAGEYRRAVDAAYKQIPRDQSPTLVVVADHLFDGLVYENPASVDALYGKRAFTFRLNPRSGKTSKPRHDVVDRRSAFQQKQRRSLGAVLAIRCDCGSGFGCDDGGRLKVFHLPGYAVRVFHNPYALERCTIPEAVFSGMRQLVLREHKEGSGMVWIGAEIPRAAVTDL